MREMSSLTMEPTTTTSVRWPRRKKTFDLHFTAFWADVGDTVYFKNVPKKKRVKWTVIGIEKDHTKCRWTKGGNPNFVHLRRDDKPHMTVWTCSNQLTNAGFSK